MTFPAAVSLHDVEIQRATPTIFEAMAKVAEEIGAVAKNLKNVESGYAARGIDDVLNAVHGPLTKNGVTVAPKVLRADYEVVEVGRNRTQMRQATLRVRFRFYGPRGDHIDVVTCGEALDSGDKATNKAMGGAFKYALLHTFTIPLIGDDADSSSPERSERRDEIPLASKADVDEFSRIVQDAPAAVRDPFVWWKNDQNFPWPWPQAALDMMREKFDEFTKASGAGEPAPARGDESAEPASAHSETLASSPAPESDVPEVAVTREGPIGGEQAALLDNEGSASGTNYEDWPRLDLVAECAERQIDVRANASVKTMADLLHAWDRTYLASTDA